MSVRGKGKGKGKIVGVYNIFLCLMNEDELIEKDVSNKTVWNKWK